VVEEEGEDDEEGADERGVGVEDGMEDQMICFGQAQTTIACWTYIKCYFMKFAYFFE
jgi:hypothetical protein